MGVPRRPRALGVGWSSSLQREVARAEERPSDEAIDRVHEKGMKAEASKWPEAGAAESGDRLQLLIHLHVGEYKMCIHLQRGGDWEEESSCAFCRIK